MLLITACKTFRKIYGNTFRGEKNQIILALRCYSVSKLYESSCVAQFLVCNIVKQNGSAQRLNLIHAISLNKDSGHGRLVKIC